MIYRENGIKKIRANVGFLLGALAFIAIYGVKILNPFYVDWLLGKGDLSQHYLGWEFYRHSAWEFPIGMTDRLAYPIHTSVIFTDSIPLLAIPFKILKFMLPEYFQYFGIWGLICFGLQGYFSVKIFNWLDFNWTSALIGSVFIILSPVLIYRMFMHTSLGAQWLLLLSIYLLLRHKADYKKLKLTTIYWGVIGFLIPAIHLYFLPMCFIFLLAYIIKSMLDEKNLELHIWHL